MTDSEKIKNAISTCIHQMLDITVEVDDLKSAINEFKNAQFITNDSFTIIPMNQACDKYKHVKVVQR